MDYYFADATVDPGSGVADVTAAAQQGIDVVGFDAHLFTDAIVATVGRMAVASGRTTASAVRRSSLSADKHFVALAREI